MTDKQTNPWAHLASVIYRGSSPGRITQEDYVEAIRALQDAMTQLAPDGKNCSVCHDSGHEAWRCHHNPLVMARRAAKSETQWRCFHCGLVCYTEQQAEAHFGKSEDEVARCLRLETSED